MRKEADARAELAERLKNGPNNSKKNASG